MKQADSWRDLKNAFSSNLRATIPVVIDDHLEEMKGIKEFNSYIEHFPDYANNLSLTLNQSCHALFMSEDDYQAFINLYDKEAIEVGIAFAKSNYFTIELMLHLTHSTRMCSIRRVLEALSKVETNLDHSLLVERFFDITNKRQNAFFQGYIAEQNKMLKNQSITDPLTTLYNRRYFYPYIEKKLAHQKNRPITLLLIDFNNFKDINDQLGHREGDRLLKNFSELLWNIRPSFDGAFRFGGDEFVLAITDCTEAMAEKVALDLDHAIKRFHPETSISFGVIQLPAERVNVDEYLNMADKRMYENKTKRHHHQ
ncbi:GGDEF domain-containing protein [Halobacillus litoralis]|uniref:GGDEF domain-containing protein n=1 Tax=Halobacillus litoralis TaxID=45668 RepID=A0A410MBG5_9BACI|nr:GGDEF domain-containing protein [Halobacillus litoralis]QAS52084.1 hypothetical protein HLI_07525 [Halobacillus litoralis]